MLNIGLSSCTHSGGMTPDLRMNASPNYLQKSAKKTFYVYYKIFVALKIYFKILKHITIATLQFGMY